MKTKRFTVFFLKFIPFLKISNRQQQQQQQQQAAPLLTNINRHPNHNNNNNNNNNTNNADRISSILYRILNVVLSILRIVLLPLHFVSNILFPFHDTDGLAPAVTAKAAQQCISYLQSLATNSTTTTVTSERVGSVWSSLGFMALKQEAQTTQSILFIYLHSPIHSDTKEFCTNILNNDILLSYIQQDRIIAVPYSIHTAQGAQLQQILHVTTFPAIIVLQPSITTTTNTVTSTNRNSNTLQLLLKAQGIKQCNIYKLMPYLHAIYQKHQITINEIEIRRLQRQQEMELRQQQDMEYQATLAADQERERTIAAERDAILKAAAAAQEQQRLIEEREMMILQNAKKLLRPEPEVSNDTTTMIRFVLPTGTKINRRFYIDETIASLRAYIYVYMNETNTNTTNNNTSTNKITNIGLSTNFPKQTFTIEDDDPKTLQDVGLIPQAVLMVQDLDA
jgi:FAS-associated factor 2